MQQTNNNVFVGEKYSSTTVQDWILIPIERITYLFNAFPDLHYTVVYIIAQGAKATAYCTATGTHKGEFYGVAPSRKKSSTLRWLRTGLRMEKLQKDGPLLMFSDVNND